MLLILLHIIIGLWFGCGLFLLLFTIIGLAKKDFTVGLTGELLITVTSIIFLSPVIPFIKLYEYFTRKQ